MKLHSAAKVAEYMAAGFWDVPTWPAALAASVAARPDGLAAIDPSNRPAITDGAPQRLTWSHFEGNVDAVAAALYERGVRAGDVVGFQLPNTVELPLTLLAINRLGAIACPFPASYREHELTTLGTVAGLTTLVTCEVIGAREPAARSADLFDAIPTLTSALVFGRDVAYPGAGPAGSRSAEYRAYVDALEPAIDDCTTICWTSGTESVPKAVPRCAADWHCMARANLEFVAADTVLHCPYPIVNMAGISGFIAWLYAGCTSVLHHPFDLGVFLDQIEQEAITVSRAAPTLLTRLLRDEDATRGRDLSSLQVVTSGSSALSGGLIAGWQDRFGVEVANFFGSNEGVALASTGRSVPDPQQRASLFPRPESDASYSTAGVRTRLVDPIDESEITEAARMGELRTSGPGVFAGYFNPGAAADPFDADGWLRTGDLFEYAGEDNQFLRFVDRLKDIVVRGGMNISSAEIESLVTDHPDVSEAAVVGVPDAEYGETVCVFVVPAPGRRPTLPDVIEHLRSARIASFKLPQRLELIDVLPRNAAGKVLKRQLRDRLAAAGDQTNVTATPVSSS